MRLRIGRINVIDHVKHAHKPLLNILRLLRKLCLLSFNEPMSVVLGSSLEPSIFQVTASRCLRSSNYSFNKLTAPTSTATPGYE